MTEPSMAHLAGEPVGSPRHGCAPLEAGPSRRQSCKQVAHVTVSGSTATCAQAARAADVARAGKPLDSVSSTDNSRYRNRLLAVSAVWVTPNSGVEDRSV